MATNYSAKAAQMPLMNRRTSRLTGSTGKCDPLLILAEPGPKPVLVSSLSVVHDVWQDPVTFGKTQIQQTMLFSSVVVLYADSSDNCA